MERNDIDQAVDEEKVVCPVDAKGDELRGVEIRRDRVGRIILEDGISRLQTSPWPIKPYRRDAVGRIFCEDGLLRMQPGLIWLRQQDGYQDASVEPQDESVNPQKDIQACMLQDWGGNSGGVGYMRPYACCNCALKLRRVNCAGLVPLTMLCHSVPCPCLARSQICVRQCSRVFITMSRVACAVYESFACVLCKRRKFAEDLGQSIAIAAAQRSKENALVAKIEDKAHARRSAIYDIFSEVKIGLQRDIHVANAEVLLQRGYAFIHVCL